VATIQEAAAQARGRVTESWQSWQGDDSGVLAGAARRTGLVTSIPDVPRTETDPTGQVDPWTAPGRSAPQPPEDESFTDEPAW
jgi:hypothetical protein